MKLVIKGTLPGLNDYTKANRTNRFVGSKMKKEVESIIRGAILEQARGTHLKSPVRLYIKWYEPTSRRDPDNVIFAKKFILDACVKAGLIENDGQKHVKGFIEEVLVDRSNPRIEVEIEEV